MAGSTDTPRRPAIPTVVIGFVGLVLAIELVLQAADLGLIGTTRWRTLTYRNGAFWAGLLRDWIPNYPAQSYTMFFSYALLHDGLSHVIGNSLTLLVLGHAINLRGRQGAIVWIGLAAAVGGGLGFALLNQAPNPMIGASGMVFGFSGALTAWIWEDTRYGTFGRLYRMGSIAVLLAILNAVFWWALSGRLAWETHLGGFVAGFLVAVLLRNKPTHAVK